MAHVLEPNIVKYACFCGHLNPITKLYFCRHCLKLRCGFCVCHEVDSHFCCNCLENIPSSEAKLKKNRCSKCFDCPSCQHTLSSRATTAQVTRATAADGDKEKGDAAGGDGEKAASTPAKPIMRKMYYLSCLACRWTSRDVGLPDQTVATGNWPDSEYAHATRFSLLMDYYQNIVLQDKQEKQDYQRRKAPKQPKFASVPDRMGVTAAMIRRKMGWADNTTTKTKQSMIAASVATDEIDELPADIFTQKVDLKLVTTVKQRLAQPSNQPINVKNLFPQHKSLSIKRSLRCKQCEHNVIKPEFNPSSIKYRIQMCASVHVPEVRLVKCPSITMANMSANNATIQIQLKLSNPTAHDMKITIMDLPTDEEEGLMIEDLRKCFERQVTVTSTTPTHSLLSTSLSRQQSIIAEECRPVAQKVNASIVIPDSSFGLNLRDDTAEFDEDVQVKHEDPKFIIWRRSNKAIIQLNIKLDAQSLRVDDGILTGFTIQYTYVNTVVGGGGASLVSTDPQEHALSSRVFIRLGHVQP